MHQQGFEDDVGAKIFTAVLKDAAAANAAESTSSLRQVAGASAAPHLAVPFHAS
jgi:hypothetical protein